jgi:NAD+ kinase
MQTPALRQLGLIVHPTRPVERVLEEIRGWAAAQGLALGQIPVPWQARHVAEPVEVAACDMLIALGGDGTTLAGLHAGAPLSCPVLGVACGSIGVLTSVAAPRLGWALEQLHEGRWTPRGLPGLDVAHDEGQCGVAVNDVAVVRDGPGQVIVSITVDDVLYARVAGDGLVVATSLGSSAYAMAAGGPILAPGADGMAVTPLAHHGGSSPPLVAGKDSHLTLAVEPGHFGFRVEMDGRRAEIEGHGLAIRLRAEYATLVELAEEEPWLTWLRRRGLVLDSPRVLLRDTRQP